MTTKIKYYPIVYVRGYAMTEGEVEDVFNMPYYGFNLGSTQYKLGADANPCMHIFESPVIRLMKEGYIDSLNRFVDSDNRPITNSVADDPKNPDWRKTLWIFRYYDPEGPLEQEKRPEMEEYAADLAIFLHRIRQACGDPADFAVNLVAHSMGGLVSRCYLQNPAIVPKVVTKKLADKSDHYGDVKKPVKAVPVNKFFTYATPHGGITFRRGLGWAETVRDLFGFAGSDVFGEKEMRKYLNLPDDAAPNRYLKAGDKPPTKHAPPLKRVFSLVGTDHTDYTVRIAKLGVGPGSDGLVQTRSAYVHRGPRAYVHRSHSGPFGIVNSDAAYQNLSRFLFGDLRFKLFLRPGVLVHELPGMRDVSDELEYLLIEMNTTIRGLAGYLHTRTARDLSAITVPIKQNGPNWVSQQERIHLYTGYLQSANRLRTGERRDTHARGVLDLRIEPHYRHDGWIRDSRYEGEWIMNHRIHFGLRRVQDGKASMEYRWNTAQRNTPVKTLDGLVDIDLPPEVQRHLKGGKLEIRFDAWS